MNLFPKPKIIECPCCKGDVKEPAQGTLSHCPTCKSDIVAYYEDERPKRFITVHFLSQVSVIIAFFFKLQFELGLFSTLIISISCLLLLLILFRIPIKFSLKTEKPKVTYGFLGGISYPEQQTQKHEELINWLNKATDDIIGFCRYISKSEYVNEAIDQDSSEFFEMLEEKTELLPSKDQIDDWQEQYLSNDLADVQKITDEYQLEIRTHVEKIRTLAEQVAYFGIPDSIQMEKVTTS